MKILILNWRDIKNPSSGGAEILTHEIAKRWVKKGHAVTQFSSSFPGALEKEYIDGVHIIRRGHPDARYLFRSVHFQAFFCYLRFFRGKVDVVIDEIHGLPFFTPLYVKEKKVALICEVADELWQKHYGYFFGSIGRLIEQFYLYVIYKKTLYLTISKSTRRDLLRHGVEERRIAVLPMGITTPKHIKSYAKEKRPTLLYVGRLSKSKGIEDILLAFKDIVSKNDHCRLWIVGRGDSTYVTYLNTLVERLRLAKQVSFFDYVPEEKKFELMARSHILLSASVKEGFGLTVLEAGFMGTPSVAYNAPGLSEVIIDHETGLLCREKTPESLSKTIRMLLRDRALYEKLVSGVKIRSREHNWDKTAKAALEALENL